MKTVYICELCEAQFTDFEACVKHEKEDHAKPNLYGEIKSICYEENTFYPDELEVPMTDGSIFRYVIDGVVKAPDFVPTEKENPLATGKED